MDKALNGQISSPSSKCNPPSLGAACLPFTPFSILFTDTVYTWPKQETAHEQSLLHPARGGGGGGGGGAWSGTAKYGLCRHVTLWRVWFSSSLLWDRVWKSESLGPE